MTILIHSFFLLLGRKNLQLYMLFFYQSEVVLFHRKFPTGYDSRCRIVEGVQYS
jgi:hypothetical protein